jgi:hypothetical protein
VRLSASVEQGHPRVQQISSLPARPVSEEVCQKQPVRPTVQAIQKQPARGNLQLPPAEASEPKPLQKNAISSLLDMLEGEEEEEGRDAQVAKVKAMKLAEKKKNEFEACKARQARQAQRQQPESQQTLSMPPAVKVQEAPKVIARVHARKRKLDDDNDDDDIRPAKIQRFEDQQQPVQAVLEIIKETVEKRKFEEEEEEEADGAHRSKIIRLDTQEERQTLPDLIVESLEDELAGEVEDTPDTPEVDTPEFDLASAFILDSILALDPALLAAS